MIGAGSEVFGLDGFNIQTEGSPNFAYYATIFIVYIYTDRSKTQPEGPRRH